MLHKSDQHGINTSFYSSILVKIRAQSLFLALGALVRFVIAVPIFEMPAKKLRKKGINLGFILQYEHTLEVSNTMKAKK